MVLAIGVLQFPKFVEYATPAVVLCLAGAAFVLYCVGECFIIKEGRETKKEQRDMRLEQAATNRRFDELMEDYKQIQTRLPIPLPQKASPLSENKLRDKVLAMANELFAFLREKGPNPEPEIIKGMSIGEKWRAVYKANSPYVEEIHFGYLHKFKNRLIDLFNELAEHHIKTDLEDWEINPPQVVRAVIVRKIAEELFLLAAKMDIDEASKGT